MANILGIHHMSAICGPAQENVDFYSGVLGLRLVKVTVNYDDPTAYHLYYGDGSGNPGSILTFFPYPHGYPGRPGRHQATVTSLSIPRDSTSYWVDRFRHYEVEFDKPHNREGGQYIGFRAPDGLPLELAAMPNHAPAAVWERSPVPASKAISGMRAITLVEENVEPTARLLVDILGFELTLEKDNRYRFSCGNTALEVLIDPNAPEGRGGHGSVHHVALRCATDEDQLELRERLLSADFHVSPVMDRSYFKSIYFREPGGVLLEIATDGPGFAADEPRDQLGTSLKLPPQYEEIRFKIQKQLAPLKLPSKP